jgi:hypothetical protein
VSYLCQPLRTPAIAIATPVYALQDNNTSKTTDKAISGYWVGILDLSSIQESIKNLNLTNNERIIVVDHNGTAIVNYSPSSLSTANNNNNNNITFLQLN